MCGNGRFIPPADISGILSVPFRPAPARVAGMVWIIALLCMGLTGLAGYNRGPIRAAFTLLGLVFGHLIQLIARR